MGDKVMLYADGTLKIDNELHDVLFKTEIPSDTQVSDATRNRSI